MLPSKSPSMDPSKLPSIDPSTEHSMLPSKQPSNLPSKAPSKVPSMIPSKLPSMMPSKNPSMLPSNKPSLSNEPSNLPSTIPTITCHDVKKFKVWYEPRQSKLTCNKLRKNAWWRTETCNIFVTYKGETNRVHDFCPEGCRYDCTPTKLPTYMPSMRPSFLSPSNQNKIPSMEPTNGTSQNLTDKPSQSPSLSCNDDPNFKFDGKKKKKCEPWAISNYRCNSSDKKGRLVKNYCHKSCDNCTPKRCKDDKKYSFNGTGKTKHTCANLTKKQCNKLDKNNKRVREYCRGKCKWCENYFNW